MKYTNENHKKDIDKFRLLLEYDFYVGEEEVYDPEMDGETGEIITEEPPEGEAPKDEVPTDDEFGGGEEAPEEEIPADDEFGGGEEAPEDEMPAPEEMSEPLPEPEPMEDEVELDITELVQGTEEAKASADRATQQITILMSKFDNLSASIEKMSAINKKIDDLEQEVERRNPLPKEQLEMRSLDSYPYSLKLTDYWSEKEGNYDVMGGKKENEEYVLTQDEVDRDYNPIEVKDSFDYSEEEENFKKF